MRFILCLFLGLFVVGLCFSLTNAKYVIKFIRSVAVVIVTRVICLRLRRPSILACRRCQIAGHATTSEKRPNGRTLSTTAVNGHAVLYHIYPLDTEGNPILLNGQKFISLDYLFYQIIYLYKIIHLHYL